MVSHAEEKTESVSDEDQPKPSRGASLLDLMQQMHNASLSFTSRRYNDEKLYADRFASAVSFFHSLLLFLSADSLLLIRLLL